MVTHTNYTKNVVHVICAILVLISLKSTNNVGDELENYKNCLNHLVYTVTFQIW